MQAVHLLRTLRPWVLAFACASICGVAVAADPVVPDPTKPAAAAAPKAANDPAVLAADQRRIADKFKRFEQVVKLLAQFSDEADQDQARLLRQVFAESQSRALDGRFDELVKRIEDKQFAMAAGEQEHLTRQLEELLAILLSAERDKQLKNEQARIKDFIKQIKQMITKQMELEGRTAEGDLKGATPEQGKLAESAGELARKMAQGDSKPKAGSQAKPQSGDPKQGDSKQGEPKQGESKSQDSKQGDAKKGDPKSGDSKQGDSKQGEPKAGDSKQGEPKSGDSKQQGQQGQSGKPQQGQQGQQGQPGQPGQSGESGEQSPMQSPQKRVEEAQRRMEEARKRLEEAKREGAMKEQEEAIRELEQAKAELEEILRQLREEELARLLEMLERRFAEMLRMQEEVYRDTQGLHAVPIASRGKAEEIDSSRLSREEGLILVEADKALSVLKEEGSAVAFPRTVEQMRDDIAQVVDLLSQTKVDELTLAVEEDVIAALKEMIEALKKAKKDLKDKKPPKPGEGSPQDQPLIDRIAELKMIRSLQLRVNRRTKLINEAVDVANDPTALEMLKKLAATELDVYRITRDIVLGKNQ